MENDIKSELSKLLRTFNSSRVVSEGEMQAVLKAIVAILADNKKSLETLTSSTKDAIQQAVSRIKELDTTTQDRIKASLASLDQDYQRYTASLKQDSALTKSEIEKATKAQNDRAFKRLQGLIDNLELPQNGTNGLNGADGLPGKDGSPDKPTEVRDKLETLKGDERLDAKAIKGLPDYFKKAKVAGKEMLVGGIRFFENLVDVAVVSSKKRQDLLVQYNNTTKRWENGVAMTVSLTAPSNPEVNDLWVDLN